MPSILDKMNGRVLSNSSTFDPSTFELCVVPYIDSL